jgi:hypothetical protein
MPTTVAQLFEAARLKPDGAVRWGTRLPEVGPGVYVVALSDDGDSVAAARAECPLSTAAVQQLLDARPELRLDGQRPSSAQLAARLASCWLADEVTVYIGLAGTSLAGRVGDYYKTPLGARRPHAGGWPLKTLGVLDELWVHYAACDAVDATERAMVDAFIERASESSRAAVCDPDLPLPFANLEVPGGARKKHGITGAREPRKSRPRAPAQAGPGDRSVRPTRQARRPTPPAGARTQRVTAKDIDAGQVRVPAQTKALLPPERADLGVGLRGTVMPARWDPRNGPDRARSGVLRFGRGRLNRLVVEDEVLMVSVGRRGQVELS